MTDTQQPHALKSLAHYEASLTGKKPNGQVVFRPGLILTVFFANGSTPTGKQAIFDLVERFFSLYGDKIRGKTYTGKSDEKYTRYRPGNLETYKKKILELGTSYAFELHFSSAETMYDPAEYYIKVMTSHSLREERFSDMSYLKIALPWRVLEDAEQLGRFHEFKHQICESLHVLHGYAGISPIMPYDFDNYVAFEYDLAKHFCGLEIDTHGFSGGRELKNKYIKGVNWITVVGDELAAKIGGREAIVQQLDLPGITITPYDGGLIIQAGDYPSLGAPDEGLPPLYVAVNRVLKPLRIPEPDSLHYHMPDRECFDTENTRRWYARFDLPEEEPERQRVRALPGQVVPHTGWWFTPAIKGTAGFRHFKAGETLPETRHTDYGEVIWYWREHLR
jgi:hypothetical protein